MAAASGYSAEATAATRDRRSALVSAWSVLIRGANRVRANRVRGPCAMPARFPANAWAYRQSGNDPRNRVCSPLLDAHKTGISRNRARRAASNRCGMCRVGLA